MLLSVKSIARMSVNVAMIEAGMASAEMSTARTFRMKNITTTAAKKLPQRRCSWSDATEA